MVGRGGGLLWWGEGVACCGGERGWPAMVGRGGGLLWWGEGVACCGGERG